VGRLAALNVPGVPNILLAALVVALVVDWLAGEPPSRVHPVVGMGRYLRRAGRLLHGHAPWCAFCAGAFFWLLGAMLAGALAWGLQCLALAHLQPWAAALILGVLLKPLLAWRMLQGEVLAVEAALGQSLQAGRMRLLHLVSRDVTQLSADEVRQSAIESLAENLNDSVVAPLFWFVLFGLPGAAIYRFANTADAMWGYRGLRNGQDWAWAGKWAARADDALSWIPARITATLLCVAGAAWPKHLRREAGRTPSPNSGWPMAAMALLLRVRLSKPGVYVLNGGAPPPEPAHTRRATALAARVVLLLAGAALLALCLAWSGIRVPVLPS
jgi:adenosylcobinamide-phosphate synthase